MARIHLFEWEDFSWFPSALRDYGTDFLQFLADKSGMYRPVSPLLTELLSRSHHTRIIDLCSGGGGAYRKLSGLMSKDCPDLKITLTDYYPNVKALQKIQNEIPEINFDERKVDARDVPADLKGVRTLFLSFHHFNPEDAKKILQNAVDTGSPIAIIEAQERSVTSLLAMLFSPVSVLLTTPFIKPFRLGRLIFTYLIPLVPLFVLWDGVVSSLRTYSVAEMNRMIDSIDNREKYEWKIGKIKLGPSKILYLTGVPVQKE